MTIVFYMTLFKEITGVVFCPRLNYVQSLYTHNKPIFFRIIVRRILNSLRPKQNGHHFVDIFNRISLNKNVWRRRPRDKPLSEPRMVSLPTHIYVTRPQWVNACTSLKSIALYHTQIIILWMSAVIFEIHQIKIDKISCFVISLCNSSRYSPMQFDLVLYISLDVFNIGIE